ncbi:hypothetical protein K440DRAFT_627769 [Wilcoxina mikolae CBS 423.85]|nr:hypothetical protein K440DRAFT_627769 [Wilcoxina mikolae CBS 423.85]
MESYTPGQYFENWTAEFKAEMIRKMQDMVAEEPAVFFEGLEALFIANPELRRRIEEKEDS